MTKDEVIQQNTRLKRYLKKFIMEEIAEKISSKYVLERPPARTPFMSKSFMDKRQREWDAKKKEWERATASYRRKLIKKYESMGLL